MADIPVTARLALTCLVLFFIVALSVVPGDAQPGDTGFVWVVAITPPLIQKSAHLVVYASYAGLWLWTLSAQFSRRQSALAAVTVAVVTGAVLEWVQTFVPGRFGALWDVLLNGVGATLGAAIATFLV